MHAEFIVMQSTLQISAPIQGVNSRDETTSCLFIVAKACVSVLSVIAI